MIDLRRALFLGLLSFSIANRASTTSITSTTVYFNSTSPIPLVTSATSSTGSAVCCFVIQETFTDLWAEIYYTSTYWRIVNATSVTILVTPHPTTTITNYETNIYTKNATFSTPVPWGKDPFTFPENKAPGPTLINGPGYTVSETVVAGTTIKSPQAGLVFSTAKVITAAQVTDSQGSLVCGTPWATSTVTFNSFNKFAVDYFGSTPTEATLTVTPTLTTPSLEPIETDAKQVGVTITLATPFVYLPSGAASGMSGVGRANCEQPGAVPGSDKWGWTPQTLIDYMARQPADSSQYPGLESCLPAGPYYIKPTTCSQVAPVVQFAGSDLTDTTVLTITPTQAESAVPVLQTSPASIGVTPTTFAPPASAPVVEPPSSTVARPVETATIETPPAAPTKETTPPAIPTPLPPPVESKSLASNPLPSPLLSQEEPTPSTPLPPSPIQTENLMPITSAQDEDISPSAPPSPPTNPDSIIASQIASIIGVEPIPGPTIISGTPEVIFSVPQTLPFNPSSPLSGSTIVISGSTAVVVNSEITIPASQVADNLPGSATLISDTFVEVFTAPTTIAWNSGLGSAGGSTTVISGTPYLVISNPTTVPIVIGYSTSGVGSGFGGNATTSQPLQASKGEKRTGVSMRLVIIALGILAFVYA